MLRQLVVIFKMRAAVVPTPTLLSSHCPAELVWAVHAADFIFNHIPTSSPACTALHQKRLAMATGLPACVIDIGTG